VRAEKGISMPWFVAITLVPAVSYLAGWLAYLAFCVWLVVYTGQVSSLEYARKAALGFRPGVRGRAGGDD
jgi:hypothetical protein